MTPVGQTSYQYSSTQHNADAETPHSDVVSMRKQLSARMEPFDSYWQAPEDVESGYRAFYYYYKANFLPYIPTNRHLRILIVSCGPGYLVKMLNDKGYECVEGIDSDPDKIRYAHARKLNCHTASAFEYVRMYHNVYDVIICEQELNHLTLPEMLEFLGLCHDALKPHGALMVYGLNGANPLVGSENLAHNIDHFSTFTEYSLRQVLTLSRYMSIRILPLKLYVFWKNPLNYVGLFATAVLSCVLRAVYVLYGKDARIMTKKIAAVCVKPE